MPLVIPPPKAVRRHALIIGRVKYAPDWDDISEGVYREMDKAKSLLLDVLDYDTFEELIDANDLRKSVAKWRADINPGSNDWLLVYYTGHGVEHGGMLKLVTGDVTADMPETAPNAQDIVTALLGGKQMPQHALLVLDTCYAASAHLDISAVATRLREAQGGSSRDADFHVITTCRSVGQAFVGHFMENLYTVVTQGQAAGPGEEYIQPSIVIEKVNRLLEERGDQRASYSGAGASALRFLPNPGWLPSLRLNMKQEERNRVLHRIQSNARRGHWNPRARGVSNERDEGWFFTGRKHAICHIVEWLTKDTDGNCGLLLKGLAGSGKSSVLARIVTLADQNERELAVTAGALLETTEEELPPVGIIDAAVHARAKDPARIALEIAAALNLDVSGATTAPDIATIEALKTRAGRTVIVLDALDEAVRPTDCAALIRALIKAGVRVLVGMREGKDSGLLRASLGQNFTELNLDDAEWKNSDDMIAYLKRFLRYAHKESPYRSLNQYQLQDVAQAIASRAKDSFLLASVTAHVLVARSDVIEPSKFKMFETVGAAFDFDLARFEGLAGEQLRQILTALACGEGRGIAEEELLIILQALSNGDLTKEDINKWNKEAAFYIVADEEFNVSVRRLYHEEFTAHLRKVIDTPREATICSALKNAIPTSQIGAPSWGMASSYILAFYPKHLWRAQCAMELSDLTSQPEWIRAKHDRFGDLALILSDLDLSINLSRCVAPTDLRPIIVACVTYSRFATTAPAIVIDVLAGLGQRARAEMMAQNIEFPLDRCQAFAFLAERYSNIADPVRAASCVRTAEHATHAIHGHYQTMTFYWVIRAALAAGQPDAIQRIKKTIHQTLEEMCDFLLSPATNQAALAANGPLPWFADYSGFGLPHWLFWAAMSLRDLGDTDGLAKVQVVLSARERQNTNLVLQTAAVVGNVTYLRAVSSAFQPEPVTIVKPGNLALALIEADLIREFDALRAASAFTSPSHDDSAKRYAWALARRGDFEEALKVADAIHNDLEEQARALYRIAQVARATANDAVLGNIAAQAFRLRVKLGETMASSSFIQPKTFGPEKKQVAFGGKRRVMKGRRFPPPPVEAWRIESWLAAIMFVTGQADTAKELAEAVCDVGVVPSRETTLAMATQNLTILKNQVRLDSANSSDQGLYERVLQIAAARGTEEAFGFLEKQEASVRSRAAILAQLAKVEPDPRRAYAFWLDAVIASSTVGRNALTTVILDSQSILENAKIRETPASLLEQLNSIQELG